MFEGYNFEDMNHYASFPQSGGAQQAVAQKRQQQAIQQQPMQQQPMQQQALVQQQSMQQQAVAQLAQQQQTIQQQPMQQQALVQQQPMQKQQAVAQVAQQQPMLNVVESNFYTDNNLSIDGSFMLLDFVSGVPRIYGNTTESSPGYSNSFQNGAIAGRPVYRTMDPNQTF